MKKLYDDGDDEMKRTIAKVKGYLLIDVKVLLVRDVWSSLVAHLVAVGFESWILLNNIKLSIKTGTEYGNLGFTNLEVSAPTIVWLEADKRFKKKKGLFLHWVPVASVKTC